MQPQTNHIKQAFNRAAHGYDQFCQLQHQTNDELLTCIKSHITSAQTIIDIGCGTGVHTERLHNAFPTSTFYALDFADQLLAKASNRLMNRSVQLIEANFDEWQPAHHEFDLIYSNLSLQWSATFQATINKLLLSLNPQGVLAFSLPLAGTLEALRGKFFLRTFHRVQDILNLLPDYQVSSHTTTITQHYPDSFSALRSIKAVGANFVKLQDRPGLRGKHFLEKFQLNELTYVIGYFIVRRA